MLFSFKVAGQLLKLKERIFQKNTKGTQCANFMLDLECQESMHVMNRSILSNAAKKKYLDGLPDPHSEVAMEEKYAASTAARSAPSPPPPLLLLTA